MAESLIEIRCPRCKHVWHDNAENLKKREQVFYRYPTPRPTVQSLRVICPECGTSIIVDVVEEADDG